MPPRRVGGDEVEGREDIYGMIHFVDFTRLALLGEEDSIAWSWVDCQTPAPFISNTVSSLFKSLRHFVLVVRGFPSLKYTLTSLKLLFSVSGVHLNKEKSPKPRWNNLGASTQAEGEREWSEELLWGLGVPMHTMPCAVTRHALPDSVGSRCAVLPDDASGIFKNGHLSVQSLGMWLEVGSGSICLLPRQTRSGDSMAATGRSVRHLDAAHCRWLQTAGRQDFVKESSGCIRWLKSLFFFLFCWICVLKLRESDVATRAILVLRSVDASDHTGTFLCNFIAIRHLFSLCDLVFLC